MRNWRGNVPAVFLAAAGAFACAHAAEPDKATMEARTMGKYKVQLTTDREKVLGTCTYIGHIQPDLDRVNAPTEADFPDYFREKAVLSGADTVLIDGRIGEAYICGPGPLNPDGTLQTQPQPQPPR
jgi:hypothetical protein